MSNIEVPDHIKQILTDLKGERESNTVRARDFNTLLITMARSPRQKISKETLALGDTLGQMDLTDVYRTFHPKAHLTSVRMPPSKRRQTSVGRGCGEKETLVYREYERVQLLWKTVWSVLKKLEIELPYDPAIPLLGVYPKKMKTLGCLSGSVG